MEALATKKYHCSRAVFYLACRMAWANCENILTEFHDFSAFYNAALITSIGLQIDDCEAIPSGDQLTEPSELDRVALLLLGEICLKKWRYLQRYIIRAYPDKDIQKTMLDSAGQGYYDAAASHSWSNMIALNKAGDEFIDNHNAALLAGTNMPVLFHTSYTLARTNFHNKQVLFKSDEGDQTPAQQVKIKAENDIFDATMHMLADGIVIADGDPDIAHDFTWSRIVKANTGPKPAGCKGDIKTGVASKAVSGVTCHIDQLDSTCLSTVKGHFNFGAIAHGFYTIRFTKPGFVPVVMTDVEIKTSITKMLHIIFVPV